MDRTYTVVVERDLSSGWLIASVPELPGCFTQAPDETTLEANIRDAIRIYLADQDVLDEALTEYVGIQRVTVPVHLPLSA